MVKVIMGLKGAGKTKSIIDLVNKAAEDESGDVICIEKNADLTFDIPHKVRLIQASEYNFKSYDFLKGFICGLHAGNYDISHVFVDGLFKIMGEGQDSYIEEFLDWCDAFGEKESVKFTITMSSDVNVASQGVKKYI